LWTGGAVTIVGTAGMIWTGYELARRSSCEQETTINKISIGNPCLTQDLSGTVFLFSISIAMAAIGATDMIVGGLIKPSEWHFYQNVLETHLPDAQEPRGVMMMGRW